MKVAIIAPYATVAPHFETELEIAQTHLDRGHQVEFVSCLGGLTNCEYNPDRNPTRCEECRIRRGNGFATLQAGPIQAPNFVNRGASVTGNWSSLEIPGANGIEARPATPDNIRVRSSRLQTVFQSKDELKRFQMEGFDLGYAALSSLVSITRDPDPDLSGAHQPLLARLLTSAWQTYQEVIAYLERNRPDRVYVFNGRFANMRAVLRACQICEIECLVHERGCDTWHYDLYPNHLPHDIDRIHERIMATWEKGDKNDRESIGASWFEERLERVEKSWHSFVKGQEVGRLPVNLDRGQKNIAIFTSSDDEFESIGDQWSNSLYDSQLHGIESVVKSLQIQAPSIQIYLRVHPNLGNTDNDRKRRTLALRSPNLTVIGPDEPLDSYALLKAVDQVVTFGSSMGIEAAYWGVPSILLGPCFYQDLGGTHRPISHPEAIEIMMGEPLALDRSGALRYGYWLQSRGIRFRNFEPTGLFGGKFKGKEITAEPPKIRRNVIQKIQRESKRVWRKQLTGRQLTNKQGES